MKQADLQVGIDHALLTDDNHSGAPSAAQVRIVLAEREARATEQNARWDETRRAEEDRVAVDPHRPFPDSYEDDPHSRDMSDEERAALVASFRANWQFGYPDLGKVLVDLPVRVLRDVISAKPSTPAPPAGSSGATFRRAWRLLAEAWTESSGRLPGDTPPPDALLGEADLLFVAAVRQSFEAEGTELLLPPTPAMPPWVEEDERAFVPALGWLRVAVGDTSGHRLHAPSCRVIRSGSATEVDHVPWWHLVLTRSHDLCGVCGGPGVRDLLAMAGFVAAVDAWGRTQVENWQRVALQRLLAATAVARAGIGEPDISRLWRVVDALSQSPPDEVGWHAYWAVESDRWRPGADRFAELGEREQRAAVVLAHDRLSILERVLGDHPAAEATLASVRARYHHHMRELDDIVPQVPRLLFTLPDSD